MIGNRFLEAAGYDKGQTLGLRLPHVSEQNAAALRSPLRFPRYVG